ncbi:MAG TPA: PaaI family thioesterase [Polyangia bacterium]|nr:PaaI family thioesterase [Polyangia bacterium]
MGEPIFRPKSCFVCGTDNPGGLNLALERDGHKVTLRFTPGRTHRGFSRAIHGGITASLLDEVVGVACGLRTDGKCATVELNVTYRRPLLEGVEVRAEGWYVRRHGRFVFGAGKLIDPNGLTIATARGRFMPLEEKQIARFVGPDGD